MMTTIKIAIRYTLIFTLLAIGQCLNIANATEDVAIIKSQYDKRQYRGVYLDNGLRVLLVSDPTAEKAGVALNVEVGSFNEPDARLGLAHFLEHMLFLGTKKYPDPNEYSKFISEHGGYDNAWTAARNTQYYYNVLPQYLPESLDRFAQFFIAPLFTADLVDRERHAVNSEYLLSIKKDGWRINEVEGVTGNPQHPIVRFSIGDISTLGDDPKKPPIRQSLIEFYNNYYSSERMVLAIVAPQSLDELEKIAIDCFSDVPKHPVKENEIGPLAYTNKETGKRISIQSIGDFQQIAMNFPIPSQTSKFKTRSVDYITFMIGQTGANSLFQFLKNKNWITGLSADSGEVTTNQDMVQITFGLTPQGISNIDNIVKYTFEYLNFLRKIGPQQAIFDELRLAGDRNFLYAEKQDPMDYVSSLPMAMQRYPLAQVLTATTFTKDTQFDAADITELMAYFTPQNLRLLVVSPKVKTDKYEKHYKVNYKVENFTKAELKKWANASNDANFTLPAANEFMPKDFNLRDPASTQANAVPQRIIEQPGLVVWHKQDTNFNLPILNLNFLLFGEQMSNTPKNSLLATFMLAALDDRLSILASQFALAGVEVNDDVGTQGLLLNVSMFSDQQQAVMRELVKFISDYKISPQRFAVYKDSIKRDLLNFKQLHPFDQGAKTLSAITTSPTWLPKDQLPLLEQITISDVEKFSQDFLQQIQLEALLTGNITSAEAIDLAKSIAAQIQINGTRAKNSITPLVVKLTPDKQYYYQFDPSHDDGVLVSYYQAPQQDDAAIATNLLVVDILDRPLYDQLRTTEQLGYVVGINHTRIRQQCGSIFYIESPTRKPKYLYERFTKFLNEFKVKLSQMPQPELDTYKSSLQAVLLQKPNSLAEETQRYWAKIVDHTYRFNFEKDIAVQVEKLQLQDVVKYYSALWMSPEARSISVTSKESGAPANGMQDIKSIRDFKVAQVYAASEL